MVPSSESPSQAQAPIHDDIIVMPVMILVGKIISNKLEFHWQVTASTHFSSSYIMIQVVIMIAANDLETSS